MIDLKFVPYKLINSPIFHQPEDIGNLKHNNFEGAIGLILKSIKQQALRQSTI